MGFLGDLFDDVLDLPGKIIKKAASAVETVGCAATGGHVWGRWEPTGDGYVRRCGNCPAREIRR